MKTRNGEQKAGKQDGVNVKYETANTVKMNMMCSHHAGALTVANIWVEPCQTSQHPSESWDSNTV